MNRFNAAGALIVVLLLSACVSTPVSDDTTTADPFAEQESAYDKISAAILLGDPETAIAAYEQARMEDPDDPGTVILLAKLYLSAGMIDEAEALLAEIEVTGDDEIELLVTKSLIARIEDDSQAELELVAEILEKDPENVRANTALGEMMMEQEKFDEAELRFAKALEQDPSDLTALQGLGNAYLRNGKSQEAIGVFSQAIDSDPEYSYNFVDRAKAYYEQGYADQAINDMTRAIEIEPGNGWNYLDRGRMYARNGYFTEAKGDFLKSIDLLPEIFITRAYLGQVEAFMGDYAAAAEAFADTLEMRPDYYPVYGYAGTVEFILGHYSRAGDLLDQAAQSGRLPDTSYYLFAAKAKLLANSQSGNRYLETVMSEFPRNEMYHSVGRYYLSGVDGIALGNLNSETDQMTRARGQLYLALGYWSEGQISTAFALLGSEEQRLLDGFPEAILRDWLIDDISE